MERHPARARHCHPAAKRAGGGALAIESQPGKGTTVRVIFPALTAEATPSVRTATPARPAQRLRILLVDDDPLLLKSLRDTLENDGHIVTTAEGGQAGINAFA